MKYEEIFELKTGDILYYFFSNIFSVYEVKNVNFSIGEITVCVLSKNNIEDGKSYKILLIPNEQESKDPKYSYTIMDVDKDINVAFENYSRNLDEHIRKILKNKEILEAYKIEHESRVKANY